CLCFFTDSPPSPIYTLSLHDALPILQRVQRVPGRRRLERRRRRLEVLALGGRVLTAREDVVEQVEELIVREVHRVRLGDPREQADRKSTRLNSSHVKISYAVFCLKKK